MKRYRRVYILLGVLAAACVATFAVMRLEERQEQIQTSGETVLELSGEEVEALSWDYEGETLSFHRQGEWLWDEDEAFPVDQEKIEQLLEPFSAFGAAFEIQEVEDFGQYGLEDPLCTIRLTAGEETYEIRLGDYSQLDAQRYVSIGDGNVYLAAEDPAEAYDVVISDLIDHDQVPLFYQVEEIRFSGSEDYSITYQEESEAALCQEDVYFIREQGRDEPLDASRVDSYLNDISSLSLADYVTYNATEEELASFGLNDPELTVEVDYSYEDEGGETVSDTFVLHVSRDPAELEAAQLAQEEAAETEEDAGEGTVSQEDQDQAAQEAAQEEITAYAWVGDSPIVYRISADSYLALMAASRDDLRHREVLVADFEDIREITVTMDGEEYVITTREPEEEDGERGFYYGEEALPVTTLRLALEALSSDRFTQEEPTGKLELGLTVILERETSPEVQIQLYRYDGNDCLAVVDGEPLSLVERSLVVDLMEEFNAAVLNGS